MKQVLNLFKKFKVGDKVRYRKDTSEPTKSINCEVYRIWSKNCITVKNIEINMLWFCKPCDIELI